MPKIIGGRALDIPAMLHIGSLQCLDYTDDVFPVIPFRSAKTALRMGLIIAGIPKAVVHHIHLSLGRDHKSSRFRCSDIGLNKNPHSPQIRCFVPLSLTLLGKLE
jgi:hypothetical protein